MPHLAMFDRVRAFLRLASATLFVIGYSFNDQHINELVVDGLRGNATATAFGLLHGSGERYSQAFDLAATRPNLTLLAEDVGRVGTRIVEWRGPDGKAIVSSIGDFAEFGTLLGEQVGTGDLERAADGS